MFSVQETAELVLQSEQEDSQSKLEFWERPDTKAKQLQVNEEHMVGPVVTPLPPEMMSATSLVAVFD